MTYTLRNVLEEDSVYFFADVEEVVDEADGTAYYFRKLIDTASANLCNTDTSFLGNKVLLDADNPGLFIFFTAEGDSIFIESQLALGQEWVFYTFDDGSYVRAKVTAYGEYTILPGIDDSLYRIKLNVFDSDGVILTDVFPSGLNFDITRSHGITELWDFYQFPADERKYVLRGLSNPDEAVTDIDAERAHRFMLGYELHHMDRLMQDDTLHTSIYKDFIMEVETLTDRVDIQVQRVHYFEDENSGVIVSSGYTIDTIDLSYVYDDYVYLDSLERVFVDFYQQGYADFQYDPEVFNGNLFKSFLLNMEPGEADVCLTTTGSDTSKALIFGDGLGMLYYLDSLDETYYDKREVVYFQKGLLIWGTPIDFADYGIVPVENLPGQLLSVYPNPGHDFLHINGLTSSEPFQVEVFDVHGRRVLFQHQAAQIETQSLPAGWYLVKVQTDKQLEVMPWIKE